MSGNAFGDLGISEPDIELAKADLAIRIQRLAERRRVTPDEAATLLKVPQSDPRGRSGFEEAGRSNTLRVLQAAAVERPEDFEPVRLGRGKRPSTDVAAEKAKVDTQATSSVTRDERQLLNKHAVEKMTSLDITTIYRRMARGTFPQPVRVGRRRVAWRTSDIVRWQQNLEVGTETLRSKTGRPREGNRRRGSHDRNDRH